MPGFTVDVSMWRDKIMATFFLMSDFSGYEGLAKETEYSAKFMATESATKIWKDNNKKVWLFKELSRCNTLALFLC